MSEREKQAVQRVRRAGVDAPDSAILAWVRSVGPEAILSAKLSDLRDVARAF
jgi:hypothetical protein